MSPSAWHWGTTCEEPALTKAHLPAERLELGPGSNPSLNYYAAYRKGRQVDGSYYPSAWHLDSEKGLHFIHILQWVKGYGPIYWQHQPDEYYKVNLFLIEHNDAKLDQRISLESFWFDPTDV